MAEDVEEGDTGEEVEKGDTGECSEWEDELDEEEASETADGLLRLIDAGRVGECRSDSANIELAEAVNEAGSAPVDCRAAAEVRGWESGSGRCRLSDFGTGNEGGEWRVEIDLTDVDGDEEAEGTLEGDIGGENADGRGAA